ncbi:hypothetical protein RHMOL_Rhmol07G0062100 [Rhododendron molle]|uniref:Uncharacterized protein n=1 Tax=Rhododendron molle TaxID=49168 RepID=A0ACC0MZ12_RHOML|nr:hypothetical protein RHMOL_Rhmol07G0062100 [Rhododendron molle]
MRTKCQKKPDLRCVDHDTQATEATNKNSHYVKYEGVEKSIEEEKNSDYRRINDVDEVFWMITEGLTTLKNVEGLGFAESWKGHGRSNAEKGSYHSSASNLTRSSFPAGFVFGAGSASYQIEGAACEDGRAPSIWDIFTHNYPEKIADHSTGDVADEFYNHYMASQKGQIGVTLSCKWSVPFSKNTAGQNAAQRVIDFMLGWFLHPLTYGDYPQIMKSLVGDRLPKFTESESQMLKMSYDYLGINYYTSLDAATSALSFDSLHLSITTDNRVASSEGIRALMLYVKDNYGNPPIFITENGVATANNGNVEQSLEDEQRIAYHYEHLTYLLKAVKEGADVKGYFIWSFLDDFEWRFGYTVRFGITYVDYKNGLRRHPKNSAKWLNMFLQGKNASTNWLLGITEREASILQINPRSTDSSVV